MSRQDESKNFRDAATQRAHQTRPYPEHKNNGDEQTYGADKYFMMSFSKGLDHDVKTGLIADAGKFQAFREAIDSGCVDKFQQGTFSSNKKKRQWEAPTAGFVFDLQGPDAQAVTMPPAPAFNTIELAYEMAEVYELALLRDEPLTDFTMNTSNQKVKDALDRLNSIGYDVTGNDSDSYEIGHPCPGEPGSVSENRPRTNTLGSISTQQLFRGSSPGVDEGPYLSQFMLIGNKGVDGKAAKQEGLIQYGALQIDQRVPIAKPINYMTEWNDWVSVQNGAKRDSELFENGKRFITTPRDLATYVHYDALYEAYLNACLVMLANKVPFDPCFDKLSGAPGTDAEECFQAGGFALWGGPHILTLVTEVATRALKAVRWQKFNTHLRLRPEVLAARFEKAKDVDDRCGLTGENTFANFSTKLQQTLNAVKSVTGNHLLPMAFQEGSPMHPSYGAGHATVAGACVTILKAFFDGDHEIKKAYVPSSSGVCLEEYPLESPLTINGELNKLAANISIGRNMAGVHFFSDYYDSLRMGEAVAIGILEEQAMGYPKDEFVLTLTTFDGVKICINKDGVNCGSKGCYPSTSDDCKKDDEGKQNIN